MPIRTHKRVRTDYTVLASWKSVKIHSREVGEMESGEVCTEETREEIRQRGACVYAGGMGEEMGERRSYIRDR